jgi:hypothetical protein
MAVHVIKQPVADETGNGPPKRFFKAKHGGGDEQHDRQSFISLGT